MRILTVTIVGLCAFSVLPLALIFVVSFTSSQFVVFPPPGFSVEWYAEALAREQLRDSLVFSLFLAALVSITTAAIGLPAAIAIARLEFTGRRAVQSFVMSPLLIPNIAIAVALLGVGTLLRIPLSPHMLFVGHVIITVPFMVRLVVAGLIAVPRSQEWASESLGASAFQTATRVLLPQVLPAVLAGTIFVFLLSFDEATLALFMQGPNATSLPATLFNYAQGTSDPIPAAASGLLIATSILAVVVLDRWMGLLRLLIGDVAPRR